MRAVVDTNVLRSGLIWFGAPHTLIELVRSGALTLISSPTLIAELTSVIAREKFRTALKRSNTNPERMLENYGSSLRSLTRRRFQPRSAATLMTMRSWPSPWPLSPISSSPATAT